MSIWKEVGLEDASRREKADFWRRDLEERLEDTSVNGLDRALLPVLLDVRGVVDPSILKLLRAGPRSPRWRLIEHTGSTVSEGYRRAMREIRNQIRNASADQIVGYANRYYRTLP